MAALGKPIALRAELFLIYLKTPLLLYKKSNHNEKSANIYLQANACNLIVLQSVAQSGYGHAAHQT